MLVTYAAVAIFFLVSAGFILFALGLGYLVRPSAKDQGVSATYECGEKPVGLAWFNFNPRFYIIALIYIVFDVEIAFIYPIATVYRSMIDAGQGLLVFSEVLAFVLVLLLGLAYVWAKGDLEWIRTLREGLGSEVPAPSGSRSEGGDEGSTSAGEIPTAT